MNPHGCQSIALALPVGKEARRPPAEAKDACRISRDESPEKVFAFLPHSGAKGIRFFLPEGETIRTGFLPTSQPFPRSGRGAKLFVTRQIVKRFHWISGVGAPTPLLRYAARKNVLRYRKARIFHTNSLPPCMACCVPCRTERRVFGAVDLPREGTYAAEFDPGPLECPARTTICQAPCGRKQCARIPYPVDPHRLGKGPCFSAFR